MEKMLSSFDVTIRLYLDSDVTIEEAKRYIDNLYWEFADQDDGVSISHSEIISDNLKQLATIQDN